MTNFKKVNPKQSFPELEEAILDFWEKDNTFQKSIDNRADAEEFNFYDGPPFATGTPHYGHILAGAIKDVIPRYQTMKGKKVERKFGWDTHGLPIENIVEKKLEIKGKEDLEQRIGVHKFNETCRENVFGYVDEWEKVVERMGRWVDMENDYKTMDTDFMESVWWVFSEMYKKGLIYEGHRVVPYSVGMSTPLSNFEVNQGYKDKQDKTVTVKFKVIGSENKYILAWTTTPWTLVANLGLAVGKDIDYVEILDKENGETYILAKDRLGDYYKSEKDYTLVREYKGSCLVGIKYEPLFSDFKEQIEAGIDLGNEIYLGKNAYSVVEGHHVTTESGTGIVHIAPAYGEDDYQIGKEKDLGFVTHINDSGKTENLLEDNGIWVFDYNEMALEQLKKQNAVVKISTINHSYPHCWRSGVPLIYKAISAWYVDVTKIKNEIIKSNQNIKWVPGDIKNGRMGKWLEGARDWNISRNRYWGSAIPVWQNEDKQKQVVIGSIEELYQANKDYGQITKVIFVRHGRTDYNDKDLFDYKNEAKLTEVGKKQAEEIKKIFENENIEAIYSSPLDRCVDTVIPLSKSKNLEIQKIDDLIEINAPELQGKIANCKKHTWDNGYGGGEKVSEVYKRVEKALHKVIDGNKGKTIVICSHGDPTFLGRMSLHNDIDYSQKYTCGKYLKNNPKKADISKIYGIEYVYTESKKAIDLHKHFVDEIFVKNENNFTAKNVLGIHGYTGNIENDFWKTMKNNLSKNNIKLTTPQFPESRDTNYNEWKEILNQQDFGNIDTVIAHSLGTRVALEYIIENNIELKRLILVAPTITAKRNDGSEREELINFFENKKFSDIKDRFESINKLVGEIIIIHSKEDDSVPFSEGKKLAKILNVNFLEVQGYKHFNEKEYKILESLVKNGTPLKRIPEVLDCWFESGSMPYASKHYMGQDLENFKFPADFIAEGLDQTRGWFYTLIIIGTALFGVAPMKNIIVNGIILAEDGKKMSKSLKNYPDPNHIFNTYGADAMRFYLLNSPVVEAQDFRFAESGVEEVVKKVILPLWNTYYFFTTYANIDNFKPTSGRGMSEGQGDFLQRSNILDKWLLSELNELTKEVRIAFDNYELNKATKPIFKFMDNLTNWYIRRSRKRFWKSENDGDKIEAYGTLYFTLVELTKIIAPFMPFISDYIYKELVRDEKTSVHLQDFPTYDESIIDLKLNSDTDRIQKIITLGLAFRANRKIRVRQPLSSLTVTEKFSNFYEEILKEELNVKEIIVVEGESLAKKICKPNGRAIGPKFGKDVKFIMTEAKAGNFEELKDGSVLIPLPNPPLKGEGTKDFILEKGDFELEYVKADENAEIEADFGMVISMDTKITPELEKEGFARDIVRHIQEARKEANYQVDDRIKVSISGACEVLNVFKNYIETETLSTIKNDLMNADLDKNIEVEELKVNIKLKK